MTGRLVGLLGSGEYMPWAAEVDRFLLGRAEGNGSVALLATAAAPEGDDVFAEWSSKGLDHYGAQNVPARVVELKTRDDALSDEIVRAIDDVSMVFFSGGNPAYLAATLRDTPFWSRVIERMDQGMAVAGCSAGACIFGEVAPDSATQDRMEEAFKVPGLAVFPGIVFGPHWNMLDEYYPDLRGIAIRAMPSGARMIGIDEDTAMVTDDGSEWTVFGSAGAHVYEGEGVLSYSAGQTFRIP